MYIRTNKNPIKEEGSGRNPPKPPKPASTVVQDSSSSSRSSDIPTHHLSNHLTRPSNQPPPPLHHHKPNNNPPALPSSYKMHSIHNVDDTAAFLAAARNLKLDRLKYTSTSSSANSGKGASEATVESSDNNFDDSRKSPLLAVLKCRLPGD